MYKYELLSSSQWHQVSIFGTNDKVCNNNLHLFSFQEKYQNTIVIFFQVVREC